MRENSLSLEPSTTGVKVIERPTTRSPIQKAKSGLKPKKMYVSVARSAEAIERVIPKPLYAESSIDQHHTALCINRLKFLNYSIHYSSIRAALSLTRVEILRCSDVSYLVVVPTLNEVRAIGLVIDEILSQGIPRSRVIVVDGGSADGTREAVVSRGVRLVDQDGVGKVSAIKTAAKLADGVDYIVFLDGDYTYPANYIPKLVEVACSKGYDLVIGARKSIEPGAQSPLYRFGNRFLTTVFNLLFGTRLSDVLSGMYVVRADVLKELDFESKGFGIESEIVSHIVSQGYKVHEIPIEYRKRVDEKGKKLKIFHGTRILLDMIRMAWRYNPTFFIFTLGSLALVAGLPLGLYVAYHYFFTGIKYYVKGLIAIILTLAGFQSLLLAILSLYMKRMEIRILRELRKTRGNHTSKLIISSNT